MPTIVKLVKKVVHSSLSETMHSIAVDFLEVGTGIPSFSSLNHKDNISAIECLEVGTGKPSIASLMGIGEKADDRHQPSYSSMCSAASTFVSAQCSMEGSISFNSSCETSFEMSRKRRMGLFCEQESVKSRKPPFDLELEDSKWHRASDHKFRNNRESIHREINASNGSNNEERLCIHDFNYTKDRCKRSRSDSQQAGVEAYSLGSGDPCAYARC